MRLKRFTCISENKQIHQAWTLKDIGIYKIDLNLHPMRLRNYNWVYYFRIRRIRHEFFLFFFCEKIHILDLFQMEEIKLFWEH